MLVCLRESERRRTAKQPDLRRNVGDETRPRAGVASMKNNAMQNYIMINNTFDPVGCEDRKSPANGPEDRHLPLQCLLQAEATPNATAACVRGFVSSGQLIWFCLFLP